MRINAKRWTATLSIVVLVTASSILLYHFASTASPRTAFSLDEKNGAMIALPVAPQTVLPAMADDTDAGPIYQRAIAMYLQDPFRYRQFARNGTSVNDIDDLPAIDIVLKATNCKSADLFASHPAQIVNLKNEKPQLEAMKTLAVCTRRTGQLMEKSRPADAMKHYEAVFSLGAKLYQERLTYAELDAGLTMMAEGSALIGPLDPTRAEATRHFDEARKQYVTGRILPMEAILSSIDQATLEAHAGDVVYFARSARDRMWRVEAIFALGRYRFNAGRIADQRYAMKVIVELCKDPDPVIRAAAEAAQGLTVEEYRMLR